MLGFRFAGGWVGFLGRAGRAADDEDRGAVGQRLRGSDDALLVAGLAVRRADAGDDEEAARPRRARYLHLLPRTDDAVEPRVIGEGGEADDLVVRGAADAAVLKVDRKRVVEGKRVSGSVN